MSQLPSRPSRRHRLPSYERLTPSNSHTGLNGEVHKHASSSTLGSGLSVKATSKVRSGSGSGSALKMTSSTSKKRDARVAKTWLVEGFKAFGRHIARNQIRVLLIDSFVMTTLFYPALALQLQRSARSRSNSSSSSTSSAKSSHSSSSSSLPIPPIPPHSHPLRSSHSHEDPLSLLSTPLLDSFFPYPEPAFEFGEFPRFFWELEGDFATSSSSSSSSLSSSVSISERIGSGGANGKVIGEQGGTGKIAKEDTSIWGTSSNSTWIVEDVQNDKSGGFGTFDFDVGSTDTGDSGSGTTTRIIAAPIVWTDVQTVLTTSRLFGASPADPSDVDGEGGAGREGGRDSAGSSAVDERLARVVDKLGRRPGVRSITCFDPVTGQKTRSGACISRDDRRDESTASGVAYLKIEQEHVGRSGSTMRSIEEVWQDVNREVGKGSRGEVGVMIESSRLGQIEGRTRSVSVRPRLSSHNSVSNLHSPSQYRNPKEIPSPIIVLYVVLVTYLLVLLSRATNVHSRFGLAFTGVVELACSSIMSFSVMALLGFGDGKKGFKEGEAIVPYYILPFVILIVGVENMSAIVKAVYSVPVSYSVPDRVGLGLAKVGPSLLFTSLSDIAILSVIGFFVKLGPVRDFCLFASILIVVHFWMLITFFLTVLSIDCQRLELDDLLRQVSEIPIRKDVMGDSQQSRNGGRVANLNGRTRSGSLTSDFANSTWIAGARKAWKARTARGGSLILLLTLLTGLYYANESRDARQTLASLGRRGSVLGHATPTLLAASNGSAASSRIWQAIRHDPTDQAVILILPVTRMLLPSLGHAITPQDLVDSLPLISRPVLPRLKPVFYFFKIILLPQCLTAFIVWLILLYLLKDAELLDAQRNKKYAGEVVDELSFEEDHQVAKPEVNRSVRFARQMTSQVILSCESDLRDVVVANQRDVGLAISIIGQVILFRPKGDPTDKDPFLTTMVPTGVVVAAVTEDGKYACVASQSGRLRFFDISALEIPRPIGDASLPDSTNATPVAMRLTCLGNMEAPEWSGQLTTELVATVAFSDGSVWIFSSDRSFQALRVVMTADAVKLIRFLSDGDSGQFRLVISSDTETTVWQAAGSDIRDPWTEIFKHKHALSGLTTTAITAFSVLDTEHIAIGNVKGFLSIWSLETLSCCFSGPMFGTGGGLPIDRLECVVIPIELCTQCSRTKSQTCMIIGSTTASVAVIEFQAKHENQDPCSCATSMRNTPGIRPVDKLLSIPIKRTPRRASRTYQAPSPVTIPERRSPSPSPSQTRSHMNQAYTDSPPKSEVTNLDSDIEDMERASHESLDRLVNDSVLRWTRTRSHEWAMNRGSFALLTDPGILVITRKQAANANESLDAQWQTVVVDLLAADHRDEALIPFTLSPTPEPRPLAKDSSNTRMSLSAMRASRLASLNKSASVQRSPGVRHPLLAFSRTKSVHVPRNDICLVVTGNIVHSRIVPTSSPSSTTPTIIEEPPRKMSAFHTAPLAPPTLVTPRR